MQFYTTIQNGDSEIQDAAWSEMLSMVSTPEMFITQFWSIDKFCPKELLIQEMSWVL